jgi:hypothetical protein
MMIREAGRDWTVHPFDETRASLKNPLGSNKMDNQNISKDASSRKVLYVFY